MTEERLIISLNEEGNFRVYTPGNPTTSYTVSGTPEGPKCTCPDFEEHKNDPEWKCQHMIAVLNLLNKSSEPVPVQTKEPQAIKEVNVDQINNGLRMEIKRSISLDGKINSLSIKALYPVESSSADEIKEDAERLLGVVSEIVENFKGENEGSSAQRAPQQNSGNGSVPAQIERRWNERHMGRTKAIS